MKRQRGIADAWLTLAVLAGIALAGWYAYQTIDSRAYTRGKAEVQIKFDAFKSEQQRLGLEAKAKADLQAANDKRRQEKANEDRRRIEADRARLAADNRRLRDERARAGFLPAPGPNAREPDSAIINRAEFQRAMEYLDERGAGIAEEGDKARVDLDNARRWANPPKP